MYEETCVFQRAISLQHRLPFKLCWLKRNRLPFPYHRSMASHAVSRFDVHPNGSLCSERTGHYYVFVVPFEQSRCKQTKQISQANVIWDTPSISIVYRVRSNRIKLFDQRDKFCAYSSADYTDTGPLPWPVNVCY